MHTAKLKNGGWFQIFVQQKDNPIFVSCLTCKKCGNILLTRDLRPGHLGLGTGLAHFHFHRSSKVTMIKLLVKFFVTLHYHNSYNFG